MDLCSHLPTLRQVARTDPDPHVGHRANVLELVTTGLSVTRAVLLIGCSRSALRDGRDRFLAEDARLDDAAATMLVHVEAHFHTDPSPAIRLVNNYCEAA